jgi:hypothetical protein
MKFYEFINSFANLLRDGKARFFLIILVVVLNVLNIFRGLNPFGSFLMSLGAMCNLLAIGFNGFRMPVKVPKERQVWRADGKMHFGYRKNNKIKLWTLTDIFPIKVKERFFVFSIGDIFLTLGIVATAVELLW